LSGLDINSSQAARAALPSYSTACTSLVMGISTPSRAASSMTARVVLTPSATSFIPESTSASARPRPSSCPTWRLRERLPVQVRTRSPRPARPISVSRRAPCARAKRDISARPRVMSAATLFVP
jgi:hypothetical protein